MNVSLKSSSLPQLLAKLKPNKDWIAKILCLLLAIGIWFLIKSHLGTLPLNDDGEPVNPPKAIPVDEKEIPKRR